MTEQRLVFLHLSDIHFSKRNSTHFDLDSELRNQLERDVESMQSIGSCTGILVSGDIAFSGQAHEYELAKTWLCELCTKLNCPDAVWVVPGNHDVERKIIKGSLLISTLQGRLRSNAPGDVDDALQKLYEDPEAFEIAHRPFTNYNRFALVYGCEVGTENRGSLDKDADQLLQENMASRRVRIVEADQIEHDITAPLRWLMANTKR